MALWHILVRNVQGLLVPNGDPWDDGHKCRPGDDAFSREPVEAKANGKPYNYVGTPDWATS